MYRMPIQGSPKGFPCPYFITKGRKFTYQSSFFIKKLKFRKERGKKMGFFTTAVTGLKTVVTAIGAGVAVWGVINLLEGYGNDNPGAKSQGIKQLMAGGGIVIVAQTVIPQLTTLFS
jgi:hypothetical protein